LQLPVKLARQISINHIAACVVYDNNHMNLKFSERITYGKEQELEKNMEKIKSLMH
jgi:hypothetical protein